MQDPIHRLEEKIAYLERHVVEQDKAMLELTERLGRVQQAMRALRERLPDAGVGEAGESPADERPPHY